MKLGDFPQVEALVSARNHLLGLRDEGRFRIEVSGRQLAPDIVQRVRPAIVAELDRQITGIDRQLAELGVKTA